MEDVLTRTADRPERRDITDQQLAGSYASAGILTRIYSEGRSCCCPEETQYIVVWQEGQEEDLDGRKVPATAPITPTVQRSDAPNPGGPTAHAPRWTAPIDDGCLARILHDPISRGATVHERYLVYR